MHADQHVFWQRRAVGNIGTVADKAAPRNHRRLHRHPAAVDLFVAQHHRVGNEGVFAQRQHVGHQAERGRYFCAPAHFGTQQAVPKRRIHRGIHAVQHAQGAFLDLVDQPFGAVFVAVHRPAAGLHARQYAPANRCRQQGGQHNQHRRGREGQHEILGQLPGNLAVGHRPEAVRVVDPVDQHEAGKHRQKEQRRDQQRTAQEVQRLGDQTDSGNRGPRRVGRRIERADIARRRAAPGAPGRHDHAVAQCGLPFQMAESAQCRVAFQYDIRADTGIRADGDGTQTQLAVFDACILEIDGIANAGPVANHQQIGRAQGD